MACLQSLQRNHLARMLNQGRRAESWACPPGPAVWLSTTTSKDRKKKLHQPKHLVDSMRERMKQNHENPTMVWESLWRDGITPWDLGGPTPVLLAELQEQQERYHPNHSWRPTNCLIPGCGSGYDVVSLGRYLDSQPPVPDNHDPDKKQQRYTIVGLEVTETPLHRARTIIQDSLDKDGPFSSQTTILLLQGDFFQDPSTWTLYYGTKDTEEPSHSSTASPFQPILSSNQTFSFIFDYTFFCAIPPTQRRLWGQQMERLLAPNGKLLTLMFPYHPLAHDATTTAHYQGPPYLVSKEMYQANFQPLSRLVMETPLPYASMATVPQRQGQEVVGWWYKAKL